LVAGVNFKFAQKRLEAGMGGCLKSFTGGTPTPKHPTQSNAGPLVPPGHKGLAVFCGPFVRQVGVDLQGMVKLEARDVP
jgi:hypothetical protein